MVASGRQTLHSISSQYGISISYLEDLTGFKRGVIVPEGTIIRFNRPDRWIVISEWFSDWERWIISLPDLTKSQKSTMFITHQLHGDLQRTCNSMYDIVNTYVKGNVRRRWVPKRFSQDPLESFFSEIRQSGGGNTDACRESVDRCIVRRRWKQSNNI